MAKSFVKAISCFALIISFSAVVFAWPVPDTGQTKCYDSLNEIPCPQPGEPYYGQDAHYTINPPSYTKLDADGNNLPDDVLSWAMVRDNLTGLIWEVKQNNDDIADYNNPHDSDNTYTWYNPRPDTNGGNSGTPGDGTDTQDFIDSLNAAHFGGYWDWRMPTVKELASIVNSEVDNLAIDADYFPETNSFYYWSSTTDPHDGDIKFYVNFAYGGIKPGSSSSSNCVRAVRGGQPRSLGHWVINGDGTVTDISTGLMWEQKTDDGGLNDRDNTYTWEEALLWVQSLNNSGYLGYNDWRLPALGEFESLLDYRYFPMIDTESFPNTNFYLWSYWSSTTVPHIIADARCVSFKYGGDTLGYKPADINYVRAVRGGQPWLFGHLIILAPQQGTHWPVGKERMISWEPHDIGGNVQIAVSREGGKPGTFEVIAESTQNDGSYPWMVSEPASANCVIRITPLDEPDKENISGLFGIDNVFYAGVVADPWIKMQSYSLAVRQRYSILGDQSVESSWSCSDPSIAEVDDNMISGLKNGCVTVSTTYDGLQYSKTLYFKTEFDQMEMEPNNAAESANQLTECRFMEGELLLEDTDYFKMYLPSDTIVEIAYFSDSYIADVRLEVFDSLNILMASEVSNDGGSILFPLGLAAGNYHIKLTSAGDVDQNASYNLVYKEIQTLPQTDVVDITAGETVEGRLYHLEDKRIFTFNTLNMDERKAVYLDFIPGSFNAGYNLTVLDDTQQVVRAVSSNGGNATKIEAIRGGKSYTLEVTPDQIIDAEHPFSITMMIADYYAEVEDNDLPENATLFNNGETIKGNISSSTDVDFYTLRLEAPAYLDLSFVCPDGQSDFEISVYKDSEQNLINRITSVAGTHVSLPMGLSIGRYYLKIKATGEAPDANALYTLTLNNSEQTNLEIESNNTSKFATPISKEDGRRGRIFSIDDVDYYGFSLPETTVFHIGFTPSTTAGDYKISLVDKDDQEFYYKTSTNGETMTLKANRLPGNYYVKVVPNGDIDQHNDYELVLTADADINPGNAIDGLKTLVSISITAETNQMEIDEAIQLTAVGNYSDASSEVLSQALWSSLDPDVGSVSTSGLVLGIAGGEATVVAAYGGFAGQIKLKVGSPIETFSQRYGNLIIVAGSGGDESDPFTQSAQYLSDLVYKRFQNRLFRDEDIYYFNTVSWHDIDGDGLDNNVVDDTSPTVTGFGEAIASWAASQSTDGPLYIYMVGHGLIDTFSFPNEILTAAQLKGFIDAFQTTTDRRVVVIIEACKSGSFTNDLVSQGKDLIVVTSTDDQDAYLQFGGRVSFTQFFIDKLLGGNSVYQGWLDAKDKLVNMELPFNLMHPQLVEGVSLTSNQTWLGGNFVVASIFPGWVVGQVYDAKTGFAIENATIDIGEIATVNTIGSGYYLCEVPSGTYTITVNADDYEPFSFTNITVALGEQVIKSVGLIRIVELIVGDINKDGILNLQDAIVALKGIAEVGATSDIRSDYASSGADVNGDDMVGLEEVLYILQKVSGLR